MVIGGIFGKKRKSVLDAPDWVIDERPQGSGEILPPMGSGAGMPDLAATQQPKGPSFMDKGLDFASGVADTLIQLRGGPPTHSLMKNQRRQREFAEAQYERKRRDEFEDQMAMARWKRENPEPNALERNVEWMENATPEQRQTAAEYYDMVTPKIVNGADGRAYPVRRSSGPQVGAVVDGFRYKGGDPNSQSSWEAVGGGSGNTAGNFRQ